jgi:hypothetical protein
MSPLLGMHHLLPCLFVTAPFEFHPQLQPEYMQYDAYGNVSEGSCGLRTSMYMLALHACTAALAKPASAFSHTNCNTDMLPAVHPVRYPCCSFCFLQPKHMGADSYGNMTGLMRTSSDAGDGYNTDDANLALQMQYQQLLAQQGGAGMQLIAVPLQGGMQGLMQVSWLQPG